MSDLEKSEITIARILTLLMDWGIQDSTLKFEELELDESFRPYFFRCVEWLVDEGIIRAGEVHVYLNGPGKGFVSKPVLTSTGFALLGKQITVGDQKEDLGTIVKNVGSGGSDYSGIGGFVGGILGGLTKSLGS